MKKSFESMDNPAQYLISGQEKKAPIKKEGQERSREKTRMVYVLKRNKRIQVLLPEEIHERIKRRAKQNKTSVNDEINKALEQYF